MSSRTNRKQKHTSNGSWGMVNVGLTILYAILALVLLFTMFNYNFLSFWKEIHSGLSNVLRAGVTPIVAHIERYDALEENADRVREIINYDTRNCK